MNILIISQYFWPEPFIINTIALCLVREGHRVDVLTGHPNYPEGRTYTGYNSWKCTNEIFQGINIYRVPLIPRASGLIRLGINYLSFIASGILFGPFLLRKTKFDVILVYAPSPLLQAIPAIFLSKVRRIPIALWVQDLWPESLSATGHIKNNFILRGIERVVSYIYNHVSLILVQSLAFIEPVKTYSKQHNIVYLPNTIDDKFTQRLISQTNDDENFRVLFAGNIGSAQAISTILDAAIILRDRPAINFIIAGDGSLRDWLQDQVKILQLQNVQLLGRLPIEDMPIIMQKSSVLLVSLRADKIFEYTVPSKIQAYMASGRPIIASVNGEGARLVRISGAGMSVPAEDPNALAKAIVDMSKIPIEQRVAMGEAALDFYNQNYSQDKVVSQLIKYLSNIVI